MMGCVGAVILRCPQDISSWSLKNRSRISLATLAEGCLGGLKTVISGLSPSKGIYRVDVFLDCRSLMGVGIGSYRTFTSPGLRRSKDGLR